MLIIISSRRGEGDRHSEVPTGFTKLNNSYIYFQKRIQALLQEQDASQSSSELKIQRQ